MQQLRNVGDTLPHRLGNLTCFERLADIDEQLVNLSAFLGDLIEVGVAERLPSLAVLFECEVCFFDVPAGDPKRGVGLTPFTKDPPDGVGGSCDPSGA